MEIIWTSVFFVLCPLAAAFSHQDLNRYQYEYLRRDSAQHCQQTTPDCTECMSVPQCSWCSNGNVVQCTSKALCSPQATRDQCTDPQPHQDSHNQVVLDLLRSLDSLPSVGNSTSCSARKNCSFCTSSHACSWCEEKGMCFPFYASSNASSLCGSQLWYRDQCLYSSTIKPCPQRTDGCVQCLSDKLCYWCKSSGNCSFYPRDAYIPTDCPSDSWYYSSCSRMNIWVVLAPILAILLAPILIFIVLGLVICCMKRMGINLDKANEEKESPKHSPPREKKKPSMTLSHKPSPSKVDELRKKYHLTE